MRELTRTYRLRRYLSSNEPDYLKALSVYILTARPDMRTDSNQITYWLDNTYQKYGDEFCVCGYYDDDKVIGFAEFVYFRQQSILFIDYLSLHPDYASQSEYLQFARMIKEWISHELYEYDFAATEITVEISGSQPTRRTELELQLYKQMGYGVAHCKYMQPPLGINSPQSDLPAHLMLSGKLPISVVRKDTVLHIVRTVYYNHYLRWYSAFIKDINSYEECLNRRFNQIEKSIKDGCDVIVNGMQMLNPALPKAPIKVPETNVNPTVSSLLILLIMLFFISTISLIQKYISAQWQVLAVIMGGSLLSFVAIFSLFHETSRQTLDILLNSVVKAFRKTK